MKLFVARHGETQFNADHRYLGALDPELTEKGVIQAKALSRAFPASLNAVVCSPLRRARQTADIACGLLALSPEIDHAFRERNVGVFEGLTQQEARDRFPELWRNNVTRQWHDAPPGGETIAEVVERVSEGLCQIHKRYAKMNVALIAHGFVAKVARAVSQSRFDDFFEWQLANGDVCELSFSSQQQLQPAHIQSLGAEWAEILRR